MKIVLFIGEISNEAQTLKDSLIKQGYRCPHAHLPDEIDQAGKQNEKAILIFSGTKIPYQFLMENKWPFPILNILYLQAKPTLRPEMQNKLDQVCLKVFYPSRDAEMFSLFDDFLNSANLTEDQDIVGEIEFGIHDELRGK